MLLKYEGPSGSQDNLWNAPGNLLPNKYRLHLYYKYWATIAFGLGFIGLRVYLCQLKTEQMFYSQAIMFFFSKSFIGLYGYALGIWEDIVLLS